MNRSTIVHQVKIMELVHSNNCLSNVNRFTYLGFYKYFFKECKLQDHSMILFHNCVIPYFSLNSLEIFIPLN